jgi:hypothetical protein
MPSVFNRIEPRWEQFTLEGLAISCKLVIIYYLMCSYFLFFLKSNRLSILVVPSQGIEQLRQNLGAQMQKPFLSTQSQFQLMSPQQQQQFLAQAQAQGNLSNSSNYGDIDPRRFTALARGGLNGKDGQPAGTDGCISSPMQSSSPKVKPDQEYLMKVDLLEKCAFVELSFSV